MIHVLTDVLDAGEIALVRDALEAAAFLPGRATARGRAAEVKRNLQATPSTGIAEAEQVVSSAVMRSEAFNQLVLPARVSLPIFSRYETGMEYGWHHDSARVGGLRADASVTLFLTDDYDGGELVIEVEPGDQRRVKLPAGSAVVYDSGRVHRVTEVVRGIRQVAVLWAESHVRDPGQRDILRELSDVIQRAPDEALALGRIRADLYRRWS